MAFIESPRFPDKIAYGARGGPSFSTDIARLPGGREARNGNWAYPVHEWDVSQGINSQADLITLRAFFMAARGRLHSWRFKDWADFSASHTGAEKGVVLGLTSTAFQLVKRYTSGSNTQDRIIRKPIASGFQIKDGSTTLTLTTDYSLDATTGMVITTSARTAANLTWAGEFDVPMRFDTDKFDAAVIARNLSAGLLHAWESIPIVEDLAA